MCICDSMIFYVYITCFYNYQYFDVGGTRWTGCRDMSRLCSSQSSVSERRRPPKRICLGECEATAKWQCTTCHFQVSTVPMHQIEYINLVETSNLWESCRLVSFVSLVSFHPLTWYLFHSASCSRTFCGSRFEPHQCPGLSSPKQDAVRQCETQRRILCRMLRGEKSFERLRHTNVSGLDLSWLTASLMYRCFTFGAVLA